MGIIFIVTFYFIYVFHFVDHLMNYSIVNFGDFYVYLFCYYNSALVRDEHIVRN